MVFKWREMHTPVLLDLLKCRQCLWNSKCEDYKKRSCRENAMKSLIMDLNLPGVTESDLRAKIKTIRTRYALELARVKRSEKCASGLGNIYQPKLFWFKQADSFLRAVCFPRRNTSIPNVSNNTEDIMDKVISDNETNNTEEALPLNTHPQSFKDATINDSSNITSVSTRNHDWATRYSSTKHGIEQSYVSEISEVKNALLKLQALSHVHNDSENEFDLFCKSLAVQLKNMPLHRALICQEKLQAVMCQERLSQLQQLHPNSTVHATLQDACTDPNMSVSIVSST